MKTKEIFKPMQEFDGLYHISNHGRVKSYMVDAKNGKILAPKITKVGYHQYVIKYKGQNKSFYCHRRVAQYFIENPKNLPFVDHIDNCKGNNHVKNLQWITAIDNVRKDQAYTIICTHTSGKVIEALSTRHAGELTNCFKGSVDYSIKNGNFTRGGWKFKYKHNK